MNKYFPSAKIKILKNLILLLCIGLLASIKSFAGTTYYPLSTATDLSQLASWTPNSNGSAGTAPSGFSGNTFDIYNTGNANLTIAATWAASGATINIGNGTAVTFTIPSGFAVTGSTTVPSIGANATLVIANSSNITFITASTTYAVSSTVDFQGLGTVTTVPLPASPGYGNIIFDNTSFQNSGTTTFFFSGNMTLQNGGTFNPGGSSGTKGTINLVGSSNQTITGNGDLLQCYNFVDTAKTGGSVAFASNTPTTFNNTFWLKEGNSQGPGTYSISFNDGGNTFTCANNLNFGGVAADYIFTGTIILTGTSGTQKIEDAQKTPLANVAPFNNLTINCSDAIAFETLASSAQTVVIKGNLLITSSNGNAITFNNVSPTSGADTFKIGGNYTNNSTTAPTYNAKTVYEFNGTIAQTLKTSVSGGETYPNLMIYNESGVTLSSAFSVSTNLNLKIGQLILGSNNLTLNSGATLSLAASPSASNSYVVTNGTGALTLPIPTGAGTYIFPVGDNAASGDYTPMVLVLSANTNAGTISVLAGNTQYLHNKSNTNYLSRYWTITNSGTGTTLTSATGTYLSGDVNGTIGDIDNAIWTGSSWTTHGLVNTSPSTGVINSGSPFGTISGIDNSLPSITGFSQSCTSLTVNVSGGETPYTYSWNPGNLTTSTITPSVASYTVTLTDANGFTASSPVTFTALAPNPSQTNISCGTPTGSAQVSPVGGVPPYTYSWTPGGQTTPSINGLAAGTYTSTVEDNGGCIKATTFTITSTPLGLTITSQTNQADCIPGTATASASIGVAPYTYSWTDGEMNATATNLSAGTYTVTAQDNSGCSASLSVIITQAPQLRDSIILGPTAVIHYWDFNSTPPSGGAGGDSLGTATYPLIAPYSLISGANPRIVYSRPSAIQSGATVIDGILDNGAPSAGQGACDNLPLLGNDTAGNPLNNLFIRSRNPDENAYMYLYLPSTGYSNIKLDYAISVSSTSGANYNYLSYSTDGGSTWKNLTTVMDTFKRHSSGPDSLNMITSTVWTTTGGGAESAGKAWTPIHIDFSSDPTVNNNPNFIVRWTFLAPNNSGSSGNDRYDNIALSGSLISETCNGGSVVSATAAVKNGVAPYTYLWNPGSSITNAVSNLASGTYTLTVTDAAGCSASSSAIITEPSAVTANITSSSNPICYQSATGSATVNGGGGSSPYKYSWSPSGGTLSTASGLAAGTYTATVTDLFGCNANTTVTISDPAALVASITSSTNITCSANGSATAGITNGTAPYTYLWTDLAHQTTVTATNLIAGTYTVTISDINGCSATASVIISPSANTISVSILSSSNTECGYGSATALAVNGTLPYTYTWSDGETNATATALSPGSYTITAQDNMGCSATAGVTILQLSQLTDSVNLSGQYEVIHYWDFNNTLPSNGAGLDSIATSASPLVAPYTVIPGANPRIVYSRPSGKQPGASLRDSILDNDKTTASYINDLPILGNDTEGVALGNLCIRSRNPDENAYMYLYLPTTGFSNVVLNYAISASSSNGANYNVFSYSTNGGSSWKNLTTAMDTFNIGGVYRPDTLQVLNPVTTATPNGGWYPVQINFSSDPSVNNNAAFILRWEFEGPNSSRTSANDQYDNISLSGNLMSETCNGGSGVTATAGVKNGVAPYTYSWNPGASMSNSVSNLATGTYTLTVTDAAGCSASSAATITQPSALTASLASSSSPTCSSGANGSAAVSVTGGTSPYYYSWSPAGGTLSSASGLNAGTTYTVNVNDAYGCNTTLSVILSQPIALIASISTSSNVTCTSNGSATATISNGVAPYTYSWNDPSQQTAASATNLTAGTYTVNITDANGCTASTSITITQSANTVGVAITSYTNAECISGSATALASNGSVPYTYSWSDGETNPTVTDLVAGTYSITVEDNMGCVATAGVTISLAPQLRDSINVLGQYEVIHYWDFNNTLPLSGAGGDSLGTSTFPLTAPYSVIPGSNPRIVYTRPIGDGILDNLIPSTPPAIPYCYINDLPLLGNDSGGAATGNYAIRSRNPDQNAYMYLYLPTTGYSNVVLNYAITASSSNGANYNVFSYSTDNGTSWKNLTTAMDTFNIGGVRRPDTLLAVNSITKGSNWKAVSIDFSSDPSVNNNANFIVRWEFEGPNSIGTTANDRYDNISLSGNLLNEICNGGSAINVTAGVKNGMAPYTYSWNPGGAASSGVSNLAAGTYTLTVQDALGCSASSTATITQPSQITVNASAGANITCYGGNNGSASASANGGTLPYKYSWSPSGGTQSSASGLSAATYTLAVTDAFGCIGTGSVVISQPVALVAGISSSINVNCTINGSATASISNGTASYTYSWNDPSNQTGATATNLSAGTYTVTITDMNGCNATTNVTITQSASTISVAVTSSINADCNTGSAIAAVSNGTPPYTYSWTDGETNATATNLNAGTYTVTVQDNIGCTSSASVTILQIPQIRDSINGYGQYEVIHYWDFNNTPPSGGGGGDSLGTTTYPLIAPYSLIPAGSPRIIYSRPRTVQTSPLVATGRDSILDNNYTSKSYINDLHILGNDSGGVKTGNLSIRSRNPDENSYMYLYLPTTGYENVVLNYAITASSTNGALYNVFSYSTNGGTTWKNLTRAMDTFNIGGVYRPDTLQVINPTTKGSNWYPVQINFSSDPSVNNISGFVVRWEFEGAGSNGTSGNDQYDNISLSGNLLTETCNSSNNYTATAGVKNGIAPYTYSWSPNASSSATASNLSAGTYTLTIQDAYGCSASSSITVSAPALLIADILSSTNINCTGHNTGTITASASGGNSPYKYSWSPSGGTQSTASGLSAGTYTVNITDVLGCTANTSIALTQPTTLLAAANVTANINCNGLSTGSATVSVSGGTNPYTYSWTPGGGINSSASGLSAGTYTITVKDNCGTSVTGSVTITQPSVLSLSSSSTPVTCNGNNDGSASVSTSGGVLVYTYSWNDNNNQTTSTANGLSAGTYTATVTDANSCNSTISVIITQPDAITVSTTQVNVLCNGGTGSATANPSGGNGAYSYSWNNGQTTQTATGLVAGTYTVTIQDGNQCTGSTNTAVVIITQPDAITVSTTQVNVLCNGGTGSATANPSGGNGIYSYSWNNGQLTQIARGLVAGTYTVTVQDGNGCTGSTNTAILTITQPDAITVSTTQVNVLCNGGTGSATANPSGGNGTYSYSWNNGQTTQTATGLIAGTYTVTVQDGNGCIGSTNTATVTITQPDAITVSTTQVNVLCNGGTGSATANPSGGNGIYSYSWNNGQTTQTATGLMAGTYTVIVQDGNQCSGSTNTATVIIAQPVALSGSSAVLTNLRCNGVNTGSSSVTLSNGTSPYTYSWSSGGGTNSSASNLSAGTYTITANDNCGATYTGSVIITQPVALSGSTSVTANLRCNGVSTGSASLTLSNGTSPYTYSWSSGSGTNSSASNLSAGTYTITANDNCGASYTAAVIITQPVALSGSTSVTANLRCNGVSTGSASVTLSNGTSPYTYSWSSGGGNSSSANNLATGTYTITANDNCGATYTGSVIITQPIALSGSTSVTANLRCNGVSTGSASVTLSNGTSPYTYSWSSGGGTNSSAINLSAGTYTITAHDDCGATYTGSVIITQPVALSGSTSVTANLRCNGVSTGSTSVTLSNGTSPYTYSWSSGGGTNSSAINLSAGTYTITAHDDCGTSYTAAVIITQPVALSGSTSVTANLRCNGVSIGSASVTLSNGTSPYTYSWSSGGGTNSSAINLSAGTYTITANDNCGALYTAALTITQPVALSSTTTVTANVSCNGGSTGSASVTALNGTSPYTYSWSPSGGTNSTASNLVAGTYTVTVNDNCSASNTSAVIITQPAATTITTSVTNVSCNGASTGSATATVSGGTSPYTYSWAATGGSTSSATGLSAGTYTVTVKGNTGCSATASVTITQPAALSITTSLSAVTCNGTSTGSASATVSGGTSPYTYSWAATGGSNSTATGLSAGTYTVHVTSNGGCTASAAVTITQPTAMTVTGSVTANETCSGGATGKATATPSGGTSPYTYSWAPVGGITSSASGLSAGTYTIHVTSNTGCTATTNVTITQPAANMTVTASVTAEETSCGGATGKITATASGGTSPYTYSWAPSGGSTSSASGLTAGTYTITLKGNTGCSATATATITQPGGVTIKTSVTAVACNGGTTGKATVTASGGTTPYTYSWAPSGGTTSSATGLSAGTYTITVKASGGCSSTAAVTITQPAAMSVTTSVTSNVSCTGGSTGSASVTPSGGTSPYTYSWAATGGSASSATGLSAGTYTVHVTSNGGCTATASITITQPASGVSVKTSVTAQETSCGGATGSATATASAGTSPYTYSWAPSGGSSSSATGLSAGTYTIHVIASGGCTATAAVTITQPAMTVSASVTANETCNGGATGSANATPSAGTSPYTYSWAATGGSNSTATGLSAGTYTIHVTSKGGCTATASVTITQPTANMTITTSVTAATCNGGATGKATATPSGGTSPYTYSWAPSGGSTSSASGLSAGTYTIHVTGNTGCSATAAATITQPAAISITSTVTAVTCNGGATGKATATPSGGTSPYTYSWAPSGGSTSSATGLSAGTFTVHVTSNTGCTATAAVTITQPAAISITHSVTCSGSTGTATAMVSGGTSPYTYSWAATGGTKSSATGLSAGTYTVHVTTNNGCTASASVTITCGAAGVLKGEDKDSSSTGTCCQGIENVNLYPNPNTGQFTIEGIMKGMIIEIYDYTGNRISVISVTNETMQINMSNRANGLYLIRILDKDGNLVSVKKMVKLE